MSKKTNRRKNIPPNPLQRWWSPIWRFTVAGILVWVPLLVTAWVIGIVVNNLVLGLERQIERGTAFINIVGARYERVAFLEHVEYRFGLGVLIALALFFFTGLLTRHFVGRKLIEYGEHMLNQIPLVSRIYTAVRQIRDVIIGRRGAVFEEVCLVEYPRKEMITVGFVTAKERGIVQDALDRELVAVFVPTTPNPTSGYLVYVQPNEIVKVNMSVEEALKLIVSGGAYAPMANEEYEDEEDETGEEETLENLRADLRGNLP
ncbi:MAG: DUF502 domain-containing protein [Candidatus Hydrogenedentota bacterium]